MKRAGSNSSSCGARLTEHRVRDELAAGETEHVAVPRVAGGDPEPVAAGHAADERQHVLREAEDAGPPVRDARRLADQLAEKPLERRLDHRRRLLDVGELVHDRDVAEAAEQHAAVRQLLPVIEALARVVRPVVEDAVERLADDHLAARRPDRVRELRHETVAVAVGRDDHLLGIERSDVLDAVVLADLGSGFRRERGEPTDPARRLQRAVACVQDAALEASGEHARQIVDPLRLDPVLAQRLVLAADLLALLLVGGEAKAPGPAERVAGELLHAVERTLGPPPHAERPIAAVRLARDVVARRAATKGEAAVAAARAFGDAALVVHAHAQPGLGKTQRGGASR